MNRAKVAEYAAYAYFIVLAVQALYHTISMRNREETLEEIKRSNTDIKRRLATHFPYRVEVENEALGTQKQPAMEEVYHSHLTPEDEEDSD